MTLLTEGYDPDFPDMPTDSEEEASRSSLALAPWVAAQALPLRKLHLEKRLAEPDKNVQSKVWKQRNQGKQPRGGFHRI